MEQGDFIRAIVTLIVLTGCACVFMLVRTACKRALQGNDRARRAGRDDVRS